VLFKNFYMAGAECARGSIVMKMMTIWPGGDAGEMVVKWPVRTLVRWC
jgi:hypothetical protein